MSMMRRFFSKVWPALLATALLWLVGSSTAMAAIVINSITVNGGSTARVAPGTRVTIVVNVTLSGTSRWLSTYFTSTPAAIFTCSRSPSIVSPGTYSATFNDVVAPTGQNVYSLNVRVDAQPGCQANQEVANRTLVGAINTTPAVASLNHVRILHDGSGLNCNPEPVSLRACADASCSSLFVPSVSVSLPAALGTWSANPVTFSGGQTTVTLSRSTGGTAVLSGTVTSPAAANSALVCNRNGVAGDCNLVFSDTSCQFDAVEVGAAPNTPIFTRRVDAPVAVDVLTLINGVVTSNRAGDIAATIVDAAGGTCSTTALSPTMVLNYSAANAGRRTFTLQPTVASANARVRLVSNATIQCSSDNFAIRPSSFSLTSANASQDPTGVSNTVGPPLKAGSSDFSLTAAAFNGYTGTPRIAPGRVAAANVDVSVLGSQGELTGTFGATTTGTASGTAFRYAEAGYFRLLSYGVYDDGNFALVDASKDECRKDANLGSPSPVGDANLVIGGKIGCYFGNADTAFFGRFVPDRFAVGPALTFTNRSALTTCVAPGFTYMGENMTASVPLLAQNAAGETTLNYTARFNRFAAGSQLDLGGINDAPVRTPFPKCGSPMVQPCILAGVVTGEFKDGQATISAPMTILRPAAAVGPYDDFKIGIAPVDADGVRLAAYDLDTVNVAPGAFNRKLIATTKIRYGRLNIDNAYGSELLNLSMRLKAQYWSGNGYATNTLDSCLAGSFNMTAHAGGINTTNMNAANLSAGSGLTAGVGRLVLSKPVPVPATKGSVVIGSTSTSMPGKGRATFGLYKAGPVIYLRETY